MHYYNYLPSSYHHRLKEKTIYNLVSTLKTCLEYEERLKIMGLPKGDYVKQTDMFTVLQLMQDMNNRMITYERKGITSSSSHVETSSQATFRNPNDNPFQPKAIMSHAWCNFCEENHKESTCEVKKNAKDRIFIKRSDATIVVIYWDQHDDVMVVNTRNKSYPNRKKIDPPRTTSTSRTSSKGTDS